ncbi:MAG: hypothetical protein U0514_03285, partial [Candidatus Andersenbacteria bacterium]
MPARAGTAADIASGIAGTVLGAGGVKVGQLASEVFSSAENAGKDILATGGLLSIFGAILNGTSKINPFDNNFMCVQQGCIGFAIQQGSQFILNLINIFYILILLLIAFATILDVQAYSMQRLLPTLVIAILLSNFGLFFVKSIADFSQLLAQGLIGPGNLADPLIGSTSFISILGQDAERLVAGFLTLIPGVGIVTLPLQFIVEALNPLNWFVVAFALTALIMLLRIIGLWLLAIAAPLGIAAGVLPATQRFAKLYWQKVIAYALAGPVLIFFVRLATLFATMLQQKNPFGIVNNAVAGLVTYFLIAMTLFIGIVVVRKMGVEVATWSIALFEKAFKRTWGTIIGFSKGSIVAAGTALKLAAPEASLLGSLAASIGIKDPKEQKGVGLLASALGAGIKSGAGGGVLGQFGGALEKQGNELFKNQVPPEFRNPDRGLGDNALAIARAKDLVEKVDPALLDLVKTDPVAVLARMNERNADGTFKLNARDRLAMAYLLAKEGKIGKEREKDDAGNIKTLAIGELNLPIGSDGYRLVASEGSNRDARLASTKPETTADYEKEVRNYIRINGASNQRPEALKDPIIARAIQELRRTDLPGLYKSWNINQKRNFGAGL